VKRPPAALSLDLDNLWSYLKTHGDPAWRSYPTYLPGFIPEILEWLDRRGLKITFFVVGRDADDGRNASALKSLTTAGHEIGNHSYEHEPWLQAYGAAALAAEIERSENAVTAATGVRPGGFRGPGFSWTPALLEVLAARGYRYDSTSLPTFIGPIGRRYYFSRAVLTPEERAVRFLLYGRFSDGFRPVKPFRWSLLSGRRLIEVPISTMPLLRTPFHLSYLLYLGRTSEVLMRAYLETALAACRAAGLRPNFLLHPLDFLGPDEAPGLAFFPGMDLNRKTKLRLAGRALDVLSGRCDLLPLGAFVEALDREALLHRVRPAGNPGPGEEPQSESQGQP
jgi:peptidoglycan-N-acetylglucosamine deacetylase